MMSFCLWTVLTDPGFAHVDWVFLGRDDVPSLSNTKSLFERESENL